MNYYELLSKIYHEGEKVSPRGEETKELFNQQLTIRPGENLYCWREERTIDFVKKYLLKELAWYLSGDRSAEFISQHAKLWAQIKNQDGTLNSNYGHLVFYNRTNHPSMSDVSMSPFMWALWCLSSDPNSRRAVITYNTGGFNFPKNLDYICTQHQYFLIRKGRLECCIALRSSDAIWGLTFNIPWWSTVMQCLFLMLKKKYSALALGGFNVQIYSAHIYERHYKLVEKLLKSQQAAYFMRYKTMPELGLKIEDYEAFLAKNLSFEKVF